MTTTRWEADATETRDTIIEVTTRGWGEHPETGVITSRLIEVRLVKHDGCMEFGRRHHEVRLGSVPGTPYSPRIRAGDAWEERLDAATIGPESLATLYRPTWAPKTWNGWRELPNA